MCYYGGMSNDMYITCLDLEGVLVPEIWIAFAQASGIPQLTRTTRDEPDYDKLMNWRLGILKEHHLHTARTSIITMNNSIDYGLTYSLRWQFRSHIHPRRMDTLPYPLVYT